MRGIEWALGIMFGLVALFLLLNNAGSVDTIFKSLASQGAGVLGVLQGRNVSGLSGVSVS